jgi:hypothetical protein
MVERATRIAGPPYTTMSTPEMSDHPKQEKKQSRTARLLRPLQDAVMNRWSGLMNQAVQNDTINKIAGTYVDAYLRTLEPIQHAMEKTLEKTMHQMQLPTRSEVAMLASRLTHIEKKLDDIVALLEEKRG